MYYENLKLYKVSKEYMNFLNEADFRVPKVEEYESDLVGTVVDLDEYSYFIPLTTHKFKHKLIKNSIDVIKLDEGKLGVLNLNNMVPVTNNDVEMIDINNQNLNSTYDIKNKILMNKQVRCLNREKVKEKIIKQANRLHKLVLNNSNEKLNKKCCDFALLEAKCDRYAALEFLKKPTKVEIKKKDSLLQKASTSKVTYKGFDR